MTQPFTDAELAFLQSQPLGRLATVDADGAPQNNPVGFRVDPDTGTIDIGGFRMGATRKFRNVGRNPNVAFVVDDLLSVDPWRPRYLEIRGVAEALTDTDPPMRGMTREVIRIRPRRIFTFGINPDENRTVGRTVG